MMHMAEKLLDQSVACLRLFLSIVSALPEMLRKGMTKRVPFFGFSVSVNSVVTAGDVNML